jgi:hypothetical protein
MLSGRADENEGGMLKCRDMAELGSDYLERELPLGTRLAAHFHLWLCGNCRRYVRQLRQAIRFLRNGPPPPPPENENKIIESFGTFGGHK